MTAVEGAPLIADWRHFHVVLKSMQAAAERRAQLVAALATLCKALTFDVRHLGVGLLPERDDVSCASCPLSALDVQQKLRLAHTQEESHCETTRFLQQLRLSLESTQQEGDSIEPTTRGVCSTSSSPAPPLFSALHFSSRQQENQSKNEKRELSGDLIGALDDRLQQVSVPQRRPTVPLTNKSGGERREGGWKNSVDEMISRRDALRDEVASLKLQNERAAVRQKLLQRNVNKLTGVARVCVVERDAFVTMRHLFEELLTAGSEWLQLLKKMDKIVLLPNGEVEQQLAGEAGVQDARHAVMQVRRAAEERHSSALATVTSLHAQKHLQQVVRERSTNVIQKLFLSLQQIEKSRAVAEAQELVLRRQYAGRCLELSQFDDLGRDTFLQHELLVPPGVDRMSRTFFSA